MANAILNFQFFNPSLKNNPGKMPSEKKVVWRNLDEHHEECLKTYLWRNPEILMSRTPWTSNLDTLVDSETKAGTNWKQGPLSKRWFIELSAKYHHQQTWNLSKNLHDRRFQGKRFTQKTRDFRHLLNRDKKCVNALNWDKTSKKCS